MEYDVDKLQQVLTRHLDKTTVDRSHLARAFIAEVKKAEFIQFDQGKDLQILDSLSRTLTVFEKNPFNEMTKSASMLLESQLKTGLLEEKAKRVSSDPVQSLDKLEMLVSMIRSAPELRHDIDLVIRRIQSSPRLKPSTRRINNAKLHVVDIGARYWDHFCTRELPRAEIKDAQPFARYLSDLFEVFGIEASPKNAHRAWKDQKGESPPLS